MHHGDLRGRKLSVFPSKIPEAMRAAGFGIEKISHCLEIDPLVVRRLEASSGDLGDVSVVELSGYPGPFSYGFFFFLHITALVPLTIKFGSSATVGDSITD